jgi:hypothetical protein
MARKGVYVLRLSCGDRYYIGSSGDIEARIRSHRMDPKVAWVLENGGVGEVLDPVTPPEEPLLAWEMRETMARMVMHGFNNVRGWEYCSPKPLGDSDVDGLFKLICGSQAVPLCHYCGFSGHLSSVCKTPGRAVWLDNLMTCCPKNKKTGSDVILDLIHDKESVPHPQQKRKTPPSSSVPSPRVPTTEGGPAIPVQSEPYITFDELNAQPPTEEPRQTALASSMVPRACVRCGRPCHTIDGCYARTTVSGDRLPKA